MSDFEIKYDSKHQILSRILHAEKSCSIPLKISIFCFREERVSDPRISEKKSDSERFNDSNASEIDFET